MFFQEKAKRLFVFKTIKPELIDNKFILNQTKWLGKRSASRVMHLDEESKTEGSREINESKFMESYSMRKHDAIKTRQYS